MLLQREATNERASWQGKQKQWQEINLAELLVLPLSFRPPAANTPMNISFTEP